MVTYNKASKQVFLENTATDLTKTPICSEGTKGGKAMITFTVDRPTADIQGVYQLLNPTGNALTNSPMLRPGTN